MAAPLPCKHRDCVVSHWEIKAMHCNTDFGIVHSPLLRLSEGFCHCNYAFEDMLFTQVHIALLHTAVLAVGLTCFSTFVSYSTSLSHIVAMTGSSLQAS